MRYLSVCSGIEAATVAWHPLGWEPVGFAEVEPFPSAVLAHHYPDVPNWGDINRFKEWPDATVDVLVGGTPCQSFSVAGLRAGLADPRGNLALVYLAIAARYRPEWIVWENVPGVLSSSGGGDFGAFIGGLAQLGYHASWRVLDAQYVRVDGYERAVPQRRRRVFVVGHLGDWRRSAAVLFEPESLSGNPPPRRQPGEGIAPTISTRTQGGGGLGTDFDCDGGLVARTLLAKENDSHAFDLDTYIVSTGDVSHCLNAGAMGRIDYETETMVAHSLRADGFDASEDGTGRGTPLIAHSLSASHGCTEDGTGRGTPLVPIAFDARQSDVIQYGDKTGPLDTDGHTMAVAFGLRSDAARSAAWAVRRLTPGECEALQGFPQGYTAVTWRGKAVADGPRYKALGNSMACNVMRWIGRRIDLVRMLADE